MKICVRCGNKLKDDETFCNRCGGTNFKAPQPKPKQNINTQQNLNMQQNMQQNMNYNMGMQQNMNYNMGMQQNMNYNPNMGMNYNPNMGMQYGMNQQQYNGSKPLFKSHKQKKAEMQAEIEMMKQMQMQQQNQMNGGGVQPNQNTKPGQKQSVASLLQNNQFSDVQPDMNVKEWVQTLIILVIPIANIVYILKGMNNPMYPPYRQNFLKAFGIYYVVAFILSLILSAIITTVAL